MGHGALGGSINEFEDLDSQRRYAMAATFDLTEKDMQRLMMLR
jgi:hypothetical protein